MFPDVWKRSNIWPIHKTNNQKLQTSIVIISLRENICLIFNSIYEYVEENKQLSTHQSGFRSNDLCLNQLLSIVRNLYKAFDVYRTVETRVMF